MASISENKRNGKTESFRLTIYLGKDASGKQIRRYSTWHIPEGMNLAKARKVAQRAADDLEAELREEYQKECEAAQMGLQYSLPPNRRADVFTWFVQDVWYKRHILNGDRKDRTVAYYGDMMKSLLPYFEGAILQRISPLEINGVLNQIRVDYRNRNGKEISAKYLRHYYTVLKNIFGFAQKYEFIDKNPMDSVNAPKLVHKTVEAFSEEEAHVLLAKISDCPLDFQCMLYLFLLTGVRRAECLGLQWKDIDFQNDVISIRRNVIYTPKTGTTLSAPKTYNSIRTIPMVRIIKEALFELKADLQDKQESGNLEDSFVFPSRESINRPRNPDAVTRRIKRFMNNNGLSDMSPHDLRHTAATLMLASGADIKSVQNILGHSDARTTLTYYAKSDVNQMRAASERYAVMLER